MTPATPAKEGEVLKENSVQLRFASFPVHLLFTRPRGFTFARVIRTVNLRKIYGCGQRRMRSNAKIERKWRRCFERSCRSCEKELWELKKLVYTALSRSLLSL